MLLGLASRLPDFVPRSLPLLLLLLQA